MKKKLFCKLFMIYCQERDSHIIDKIEVVLDL